MATTIVFTGSSGKKYQYDVYNVNVNWNPRPGNYGFIDENGVPKYFGQTEDFVSRNPGPAHDKWAKASANGATLIVARVNHGGETARKAEEVDLIRAYNPPTNIQHRTSTPLGRVHSAPYPPVGRTTLLGG